MLRERTGCSLDGKSYERPRAVGFQGHPQGACPRVALFLLHPWMTAIWAAAQHTLSPFLSPISGAAQPAFLAVCAGLTLLRTN